MLREKALSADKLEFIFRHELIHCRHKDIWMNLPMMAASAVHWFSPLIWIMAGTFRTDCEAACDESAAAGSDKENRRRCGEAIISFAGAGRSASPILTTYFYGSTCKYEEEIKIRTGSEEKAEGMSYGMYPGTCNCDRFFRKRIC